MKPLVKVHQAPSASIHIVPQSHGGRWSYLHTGLRRSWQYNRPGHTMTQHMFRWLEKVQTHRRCFYDTVSLRRHRPSWPKDFFSACEKAGILLGVCERALYKEGGWCYKIWAGTTGGVFGSSPPGHPPGRTGEGGGGGCELSAQHTSVKAKAHRAEAKGQSVVRFGSKIKSGGRRCSHRCTNSEGILTPQGSWVVLISRMVAGTTKGLHWIRRNEFPP